jgi:hypothetical protein
MLTERTGSTRVLRGSLVTAPITFEKVSSLPNGADASNELSYAYSYNTATGETVDEQYSRSIFFKEWDESDELSNERHWLAAIHEISHSWDSDFEISRGFSMAAASKWNQFLAASGWRTSPASGFIKADFTTSEPFDIEWNAATRTFEQNEFAWWYRDGTEFARSYGDNSPQEDWATVWESVFGSDRLGIRKIPQKMSIVNAILNLF